MAPVVWCFCLLSNIVSCFFSAEPVNGSLTKHQKPSSISRRQLNEALEDSQRKEALKCMKSMPKSRAAQLFNAMLGPTSSISKKHTGKKSSGGRVRQMLAANVSSRYWGFLIGSSPNYINNYYYHVNCSAFPCLSSYVILGLIKVFCVECSDRSTILSNCSKFRWKVCLCILKIIVGVALISNQNKGCCKFNTMVPSIFFPLSC